MELAKKIGLFSVVLLCVALGYSSFQEAAVRSEVDGYTLSNLTPENNFEQIEFQVGEAYGSEVVYIELPVGFHFYKAMDLMTDDNNSLSNARANNPSWFGDMITAMRYIHASKTWNDGEGVNWDLHAFKTIRPARLLLLSNLNNLELLYRLAKVEIEQIADEIRDIELQIAQEENHTEKQLDFLKRSIQEKKWELASQKKDLTYFQIATGYGMSWKDQLDHLRHTSLNGESRVESRLESQDETEGRDPNHELLNRISYTPEVDASILKIIKRYLSVDGYYNPKVYSRWHFNHIFQQEVAFDQTRGLLVRDYQNPFDWTNKDSSPEYDEAFSTMKEFFELEVAQ